MSTPRAVTFHGHRRHVNPWLLAVTGLAAALIGLSTWVIVDQTTSERPPPAEPATGLASGRVATMLDARLAALSSGGKQAMTRFYSRDAVQEELDQTPTLVTRGGANVAAHNEGYSRLWALQGLRITREGPVIQLGNYAAHAIRLDDITGIAVFELDPNGRIAHQWVFGGRR